MAQMHLTLQHNTWTIAVFLKNLGTVSSSHYLNAQQKGKPVIAEVKFRMLNKLACPVTQGHDNKFP